MGGHWKLLKVSDVIQARFGSESEEEAAAMVHLRELGPQQGEQRCEMPSAGQHSGPQHFLVICQIH